MGEEILGDNDNRVDQHAYSRARMFHIFIGDWEEIAADMQSRLTDQVIEDAFLAWPEAIYSIDAEEIIQKLKSRRDDLVEYAEKFYRIIAVEVEILGTHKHEYFEVVPLNKVYFIRIIGGEERDRVLDRSEVGGLKRYTALYDTEEGNELDTGKETRDFRAPDHVEYFN